MRCYASPVHIKRQNRIAMKHRCIQFLSKLRFGKIINDNCPCRQKPGNRFISRIQKKTFHEYNRIKNDLK